MAVYYKFKSAKDYDSATVDGHFISVLELKERIVGRMKLVSPPQFDLVISNAQTNEEYLDEAFLVPKNTSVIVRRVPGAFRLPVITEKKPQKKPEPIKAADEPPPPPPIPVVSKSTAFDWSDDFGVDLYEDIQVSKPQSNIEPPAPASTTEAANAEEEAKIRAFCDSTASDWQRQTEQGFAGRGYGRGGGQGGRGAGRGTGFMRKTPPEGYVCHRCNEPGHFIQHCPTNKDPSFNVKRVRLPTGIPRTMLVANPSGSYALPNGEIATLRPNEELFDKEVNALTMNRTINEVPSELRCPLCKEVLKDAVLTSKCCFKSFCDQCIRNEIIVKGRCVCGATHVLADDLLPNRTLRDAIDRLLESAVTTSSGGNPGSRLNCPDMFSTLKAASPATERLPQNLKAEQTSPTQKIEEKIDDVPEVNSSTVVEPPLQNGNSNEQEQEQEQQQQQQAAVRRNNSKHRPPKQMMSGQIPWEDGQMMGYGPPIWPPCPMGNGFMPMGDAYMMPYGGPYNGFVPFDAQFNAVIPGYQGMLPPPYAPQRAYGPGRSNSAVMSREEFEAKKFEARRKQDHREREQQHNGFEKREEHNRVSEHRSNRNESGQSSGDDSAERRARHKQEMESPHRPYRSSSRSDAKRSCDEQRDVRRSSDEYRRDSKRSSSKRDDHHHRDRHYSDREDGKHRRERDAYRDYDDRDDYREHEEGGRKSRRVSVFLRVKADEREPASSRKSSSKSRIETNESSISVLAQ